MSKKSKYKFILEKAVHCALSAIEIYNKPDFKYREETFVILITNAWELIFKAKILKESKNNLSQLHVVDKNKQFTLKGQPRKYPIYSKNRCGNYKTIDIFNALEKVSKLPDTNIDKRLKDNIEVLVELRDNSVHFYNECPNLKKKVLEVGTATLRSFVTIANEWFEFDLSKYNFYLMPLSFYHTFEMDSFSVNKAETQVQNLLKYINLKEELSPSDETQPHNISLLLETKFVKSKSIDAFNVKFDNKADISVKVDAEQLFANKYQLSFKEDLIPKLKERYSDFKMDTKFWDIKRELEKDNAFCGERFLDIKRKKGATKKFYSTEIIKEFDKHYTRKKLTLFDD